MNWNFALIILLLALLVPGCGDDSGSSSDSNVSDGGSTSKFAIQNGYLYVATDYTLVPFNLSLPDVPSRVLGGSGYSWTGNIETLISYGEDYLLIGTTGGMEVYQSYSDGTLSRLGGVRHWRGCDPVLPFESVAFNTVRSGIGCGRMQSNLRVIDLQNPDEPEAMFEYFIESPRGMGIFNRNLYVCQGEDFGVIQYRIESDYQLTKTGQYDQLHCEDVIVKADLFYFRSDIGTEVYRYQAADEAEGIQEGLTKISEIMIGDLRPTEEPRDVSICQDGCREHRDNRDQ